MSFVRYDQRKPYGLTIPAVSLGNGKLLFNQVARDQVVRAHRYVDLYWDSERKLVGLRFLRQPTDLNSFKVGYYANNGRVKASARLFLTRFFQHIGLAECIRGPARQALELKSDPVQNLWWFSVATLLEASALAKLLQAAHAERVEG